MLGRNDDFGAVNGVSTAARCGEILNDLEFVDEAGVRADVDRDCERTAEFENLGHGENDEDFRVVGDRSEILAQGDESVVEDNEWASNFPHQALGEHGGVGVV